MDLIIRPIYPNPKNYPANLIPKLDSAIYAALSGPVKIRTKNAMADRTRNWEKGPSMGSRYTRPVVDEFILRVFPTGSAKAVKRWRWVSRGTKSHMITATNAPTLRFQENYTSHTKPGNRYGMSGGGTYSGDWRTPKTVMNPGIEAREFEEHVVDQIRKDVVKDIQKAINLALR